MTHTKDKEDGLWSTLDRRDYFMYYDNVFMDFEYYTEDVIPPKQIDLLDTLVIPYEFL